MIYPILFPQHLQSFWTWWIMKSKYMDRRQAVIHFQYLKTIKFKHCKRDGRVTDWIEKSRFRESRSFMKFVFNPTLPTVLLIQHIKCISNLKTECKIFLNRIEFLGHLSKLRWPIAIRFRPSSCVVRRASCVVC
jgi:hypothetical protein